MKACILVAQTPDIARAFIYHCKVPIPLVDAKNRRIGSVLKLWPEQRRLGTYIMAEIECVPSDIKKAPNESLRITIQPR